MKGIFQAQRKDWLTKEGFGESRGRLPEETGIWPGLEDWAVLRWEAERGRGRGSQGFWVVVCWRPRLNSRATLCFCSKANYTLEDDQSGMNIVSGVRQAWVQFLSLPPTGCAAWASHFTSPLLFAYLTNPEWVWSSSYSYYEYQIWKRRKNKYQARIHAGQSEKACHDQKKSSKQN